MYRPSSIALLALAIVRSSLAQNPASIEKGAMKYVPGMAWQRLSVVSGDFSCLGRKQPAILGTSASEIVIVVFLNGLETRPQVLRYSAKALNPKTLKLAIEDLNQDPKEIIGIELPGFRPSKSCKGLNLSDGETDSSHIYWNHDSQRFDAWRL